MSQIEIAQNYKLCLLDSFVNEFQIWNCCVGCVNSSIDEINSRFKSEYNHITYDDFCKSSIGIINSYVDSIDFEDTLSVGEADIGLSVCLRERRVKAIESELYKLCIMGILNDLAPKEFLEYRIIFELQWEMQKSPCNQQLR